VQGRGLKRLIVIDGPAASGKSTLARRMAWKLGLPFLSTGALYRAVTWFAITRGVKWGNSRALVRLARKIRPRFVVYRGGFGLKVMLGRRDILPELDGADVSRLTSAYTASDLAVRQAIVENARKYLTGRGLVAEGRDCGSVIFPEAPFKIFLTSDPAERARRRYHDLRKAGERISLRKLVRDMVRRDREDRTRKRGALVAMPDAWIVDNTFLQQHQTIRILLRRVRPDVVA